MAIKRPIYKTRAKRGWTRWQGKVTRENGVILLPMRRSDAAPAGNPNEPPPAAPQARAA